MRPYIAQIRSNLRLMARDRAVLFFSYLFPLTFFFIFAQTFRGSESSAAMAQVIASVLVIGVLGNGFFGAGMRAVQDRETNVLRRFKVAPVGASPIIVASLVSGLVAFLPSVVSFFVFAHAIYHMTLPRNVLSVFVFVCVAVIAFRAMGMIIAAVVNSAQEAGILTQILYLPMLFLSGATFPTSIMPTWLQSIAQFMPATYLYQGIQSLMIGGESLLANLVPLIGLAITFCVAMIVGTKLFRWEKEERISNTAKLWVLGVLAPFIVMGAYQVRTQQNISKARVLARNASRGRTILFQHARIFIGDGRVIPDGAVLVKNGKIAEVFTAAPEDTKPFDAEVINSAGKTLMPGLIDMHVHIGAPGGVYKDAKKYGDQNLVRRRLAAYLYSGVTAVRSTGDWLDNALKLREEVNSGAYLGAEFFSCGPLFTAEGGHPTELIKAFPESMRKTAEGEFVRLPKSADEGRGQVDALKAAHVDCIKAVLESGSAQWGLFNHLDPQIYRAVIAEAQKDNLPTATHTGDAGDVSEAVDAGTNSIEHGSTRDDIPAAVFARMKAKAIAYDPTLSVFNAVVAQATGNPEPLDGTLVQQVGPSDLLNATREMLAKGKRTEPEHFRKFLQTMNHNLLDAYQAGVTLIAGSDAGNMMVIHGPTIQRELQLWVKAGIPATTALQAATYNAAKVLCAENRIGSIQNGRDASLILLEGDPTQDISNLERISIVMFRGERIARTELFDQEKP
ncbi:MAG: ABC transporter permease [Acidobacteriaceae bacterium]|nr:ABC transporter permease [Acidobacteriaceae bacterium]